MSVCHWNELDQYDEIIFDYCLTFNGTYVKCDRSYVGTKCTECGSAVHTLLLSNF